MALNDIQLPGFVIGDLYKGLLVLDPNAVQTKKSDPRNAPGYPFLGNNARKITLLVNEPGVAFLEDAGFQLISKMLEACRINTGDVAILNMASTQVTIGVLQLQLAPKTLILFGMDPTTIGLPFNTALFKIQEHDGCKYLYVPAISNLLPDTEAAKLLKSKLWVCLRSLFEV